MMDSDFSLDFEALLDASFQELDEVKRGDLLDGTLQALDEGGIVVNLGLKRDGIVSRFESVQLIHHGKLKLGQSIRVMVLNPEDHEGNLIVSIREAESLNVWAEAERQQRTGEFFTGEIIDANKGGLIIDYHGLRGFIPSSHLASFVQAPDDQGRVEALRRRIGDELTVKFLEVEKNRRRLIFSEKEAHAQQRASEKRSLLESLSIGDTVEGVVRNLRDFGAFIDIGGIDGLVHISELSWVRVNHPEDVLRVGDRVQVKIISIDLHKRQVGLSIKQLTPNPWDLIADKCCVGEKVSGVITRITEYGVFVEIMEGIEALLHASEMVDDEGKERYREGNELEAYIISFEPDRQRIGLSTRQQA